MKRTAVLALLAGVVAATLVVAHQGFHAITDLALRSGWKLLLLIPLHGLPLLPDVIAWRALIIGKTAVLRLYWIATVRQAVNRLLPVASIGGELVGIRLLRRAGIDGRYATASVVVEVVITIAAEYAFVMLGVVALLRVTGLVHLIHALTIGMLISLPLIIIVSLVIRHGSVFERVQRYAVRVLANIAGRNHGVSDTDGQGGAGIDAAIRETCNATRRLLLALAWQLLNMICGCLETWAALRLLGTSATFADALILESLTSAARHILFFVPAGLGVQELSFVGLGQLLGISGDIAIALSLAKRMTDLAVGVPALLSWQWVEGRRYWTQSPVERDRPPLL